MVLSFKEGNLELVLLIERIRSLSGACRAKNSVDFALNEDAKVLT